MSHKLEDIMTLNMGWEDIVVLEEKTEVRIVTKPQKKKTSLSDLASRP